MNLDTVRELLLEDPFVPVEIRLANGDRHRVTDPFNVAVGKNIVVIAYSDSNRTAWCTPHQIVSIEKVKGAKSKPNGRRKWLPGDGNGNEGN
jgi:hypothetical protein